jgi:hypothetical protein
VSGLIGFAGERATGMVKTHVGKSLASSCVANGRRTDASAGDNSVLADACRTKGSTLERSCWRASAHTLVIRERDTADVIATGLGSQVVLHQEPILAATSQGNCGQTSWVRLYAEYTFGQLQHEGPLSMQLSTNAPSCSGRGELCCVEG